MYCSNCGAQIEGNGRFCNRCGSNAATPLVMVRKRKTRPFVKFLAVVFGFFVLLIVPPQLEMEKPFVR